MNQESYRMKLEDVDTTNNTNMRKPWDALDPNSVHPLSHYFFDGEGQNATQTLKELQLSQEFIFIRNSLDVNVNTTDTKAALSIVAALNAAISLILNISIASSSEAEEIKQNLFQSTGIKQINIQQTVIENSRNVSVETTDTQIAINIQLLLQILLALLINLDIL